MTREEISELQKRAASAQRLIERLDALVVCANKAARGEFPTNEIASCAGQRTISGFAAGEFHNLINGAINIGFKAVIADMEAELKQL